MQMDSVTPTQAASPTMVVVPEESEQAGVRLERDGILRATPYSKRPPRMEYALTADGRDLAGALRLLADWGARRSPAGTELHDPIRHASCGTPLEARWYCPTCAIAVSDHDAAENRAV